MSDPKGPRFKLRMRKTLRVASLEYEDMLNPKTGEIERVKVKKLHPCKASQKTTGWMKRERKRRRDEWLARTGQKPRKRRKR